MLRHFVSCFVVILLCGGKGISAEKTASLQSSDTILQLHAGLSMPQLLTITSRSGSAWYNGSPETLIKSVEVDGHETPIDWKFNEGASRIEARRIGFTYESESPHMRLTWEWEARAAFGPVEHQIHIQNLSDRELWLPLQDSLHFNLPIKPQVGLEEIYIEKGASTPSDVGTHHVEVPVGYKWHGTSSTYAHPKASEPREIIPWFLLQKSGGSKEGWYIGNRV
jgi:hypothetical protein